MKKKKQTFSVLFWLRKGRASENVSPLYCRVTISGQRYEIPMNMYLSLSSWSASAQRAIGRTVNDKETNRCIERMNDAIEETVTKLRQKEYALSIENFKLMYQAQDNEYSTISTLFQYHDILYSKKLSHSSNVQYAITLNHLLAYVRIKYRVSDYDINAIDKAFVQEFFAYLQGFRRKDCKKLCTTNGALKHIQRFNTVMNIALENDWISRNPVGFLRAKKDKTEKGYLTEKEIKSIEKTILKPHLAIVRDLFLFAVYTGTAYVDVCNLTRANISIGIDGTPWLYYHRQKTNTRVSLPLLEPAYRILQAYECYHSLRTKGKLFPITKNQVVNRYLKTIASEAGIEKTITFHMGSHNKTFIHLKISRLQIYFQRQVTF